MNLYLFAKYIHLIGIVMMLGATFCNGLIHLNAMKDKSIKGKLVSLSNILTINRLIMIPGFILLISAGFSLVYQLKLPLINIDWLVSSIILTTVLVIEFIWGYLLEQKLEKLTNGFQNNDCEEYRKGYKSILSIAIPIGSTATMISLLVMFLMITKPY